MLKSVRMLPIWSYPLFFIALLPFVYLACSGSEFTTRLSHRCYDPRVALERCYMDYYDALAKKQGAIIALATLDRRKRTDARLSSGCHEAMHEIGHQAYRERGSIAAAYAMADYGCWGGYLHGVVEESLAGKKLDDIASGTIRALCDEPKRVGDRSFGYFSCVHGVGHALMLVSDNDLFGSLRRCADLPGEWEELQCGNGAFMQNMFSKYNGHYSDYLPKDDLNFPCNTAPEKHRVSCYQVQSRPILDAYGFDFARAFAFCASVAPDALSRACVNGLGAAVSNYSDYDPKRIADLCALAAAGEEACLYGALTDLEGVAGDATLGERVCDAAKDREFCMKVLAQAEADFPGSVRESDDSRSSTRPAGP